MWCAFIWHASCFLCIYRPFYREVCKNWYAVTLQNWAGMSRFKSRAFRIKHGMRAGEPYLLKYVWKYRRMCTTRRDKKMNINQTLEARLLTSHKQDLLKVGKRNRERFRYWSDTSRTKIEIHRSFDWTLLKSTDLEVAALHLCWYQKLCPRTGIFSLDMMAAML